MFLQHLGGFSFHFPFASFVETLILTLTPWNRLHKEIRATRGSDFYTKKKNLLSRTPCFVVTSSAEGSPIQWSNWEAVNKWCKKPRHSVSAMKRRHCRSPALHSVNHTLLFTLNTNTVTFLHTQKVAPVLINTDMVSIIFFLKYVFFKKKKIIFT